MEKQTVTICNAQMIRGAKYAGFFLGYKLPNGETVIGNPEDIIKLRIDDDAVFLKALPEEINHNGWDEIRTKKYEIVAKRIGDDQWEVPLEIILAEFL
jgi:hypothetical protein